MQMNDGKKAFLAVDDFGSGGIWFVVAGPKRTGDQQRTVISDGLPGRPTRASDRERAVLPTLER